VPVVDLLLSELPTEKRLDALDPRREVDEAGVRILHDRTEAVDRVHAAGDTGVLGVDELVEPGELPRVDAAAVACDLQCKLGALRLRVDERRAMRDELLGQRPDLDEERVRLLPREVPRRHARIIETLVARGQRDWSTVDAVTIDAYGTLLELRDPVGSLARVLPGFDRGAIDRAFRAEVEYYAEHAVEGRNAGSLAKLRTDCARVFNEALGSSLGPEQLVGALEFTWVDGEREAIERLRARGLALAVVSNWDVSLHERLDRLGIPVVTSADAGVRKPDPAVFRLALEQLGVPASRTLHVGDTDHDRDAAAAAGIAFAPAPLAVVA
jgi:putative hydrolase of the HAD superfamily